MGSAVMPGCSSVATLARFGATRWSAAGQRWPRLAGVLALCQVGLSQPIMAQASDRLPVTSVGASGEQAVRYPSGPRLGLELSYGWPHFGGAAAEVWDEAPGQTDSGPGLNLRLGYDLRRFGFTVGLELAEFSAGDSIGGAAGLVGLLHWRPGIQVGNAFESVITAGYVRKVAGSVNFERRFPEDVCIPSFDGICSVSTIGDGLRLGVGVESPGAAKIAFVGNVSLDLISFRQVEANGLTALFSNSGWSVWPLLAVGVEWRPF